MSGVQKLRKSLISLIEDNLNKFDGRSISKFYQIAYNGQSNKITKTIEFIKNFLDQSNNTNNNDSSNDANKINYKSAKDKVVQKAPLPEIKEKSIAVKRKKKDKKLKKSDDPLDEGIEVKATKSKKVKLNDSNNFKTNNITIILYTYDDEEKNNEKNYKNKRTIKKDNKKLNQIRTINLTINVKNDINNYLHKYTFDYIDDKPNPEFNQLISYLNENDDFKNLHNLIKDYLNAIYVLNIVESNKFEGIENVNLFKDDLLDEDNFNYFINKCVFSKYVKPSININAKTFMELFYEEKKNYVKENYKNNSCFINAIIENFKDAFDVKKSDGKRKFKELTYDYLLNILDIENNKQDNIGLSINRAVEKFFKVFKLGLDVIYKDNILIYKYRPEKLNPNIKPNIMRIGITNENHIYLLNDEINSFDQIKEDNYINIENLEQKYIKELYLKKLDLKVNDKYYVKKIETENENEIDSETENKENIESEETNTEIIEKLNIINNIDDILKYIIKLEECEKNNTFIKLIYNDPLDNLVIDIKENGYIPDISFDNGKITSIKIKVGAYEDKKFIMITNVILKANDREIIIDDVNTLKNYYDSFKEFYDTIFRYEYRQTQHENTLNIDNYYSINAISGFFGNETKILEQTYDGIDIRKCYTYCLTKIDKIPVFDYFDIYKPYNQNEKIEPYNKYVIELISTDNISCMMFPSNKKFNRCYGIKLINLPKCVKYNIINVCRPSKLMDINLKKSIDELYNKNLSDIPEYDQLLKKHIVNVCTGLLEKKYNKANNVTLFDDYKKCLSACKYFGGSLKTITKYDYQNLEMDDLDNIIDNFKCNELNNICISRNSSNNNSFEASGKKQIIKSLYASVIEVEKELTCNFRQIKDLIYDLSHLEILKVYNTLINNNIEVYGVKTDCILYKNNKNIDINELFNFENKLGCYKKEYEKKLTSTPLNLRLENSLIDIIDTTPITHLLKMNIIMKNLKIFLIMTIH
jgi:hypothetical protein